MTKEEFDKLWEKFIKKLDNKEGVTKDEIQNIFKIAANLPEEEQEKTRREDPSRGIYLDTCTLNFPRGWKTASTLRECQKLLPQTEIKSGNSLEETIAFLNNWKRSPDSLAE